MARYSSEPPIMLPILRRDVFNMALHQQIHLCMQIYVLEPVYNLDGEILINNHQQLINHPQYIDVTHGGNVNIQEHNQKNIHISPNNSQATNNGPNVNRPNNGGNNNNNRPNLSAMQRLANYSQQIYNENVNSENEVSPAFQCANNPITRRQVWPTYPEVGDLRTTLEFYGLSRWDYSVKSNSCSSSSSSSSSSSASSYDTVDEPDR